MFRSALVFTLVSVSLLTLASTASAKDRKPSSAVKVHICESVDLYTDVVDSSHPATRIAESCRDVSVSTAQKAIDKCSAKNDASKCEVLYSADKKTLMIETKIVVTGGAK